MPAAAWLGTFIGAVLKECGPMIVEIIAAALRKGFAHEVIDSEAPEDLKNRLQARLDELHERMRKPGDIHPQGGAGAVGGTG